MTISALYYLYQIVVTTTPDAGDPDIDAQIATTLGVASLPYTSNDADAQALIPSGWSWALNDQEDIIIVRDSDQRNLGYFVYLDQVPVPVPDPLMHCVLALQARLVEANDVS